MDQLRSIVEGWIAREPAASLWVVAVAILLLGVTLARSQAGGETGWAWGRCLIEASIKALIFSGLLGGAYFLLDANSAAFSRIYSAFTTGSSLSNLNWKQWQNQYGGPQDQQDLQVAQYVTVETQETLQPADPSVPVLYRHIQVEQPVQQNSIAGFRGHVTLNMADPAHRDNAFNGYALEAVYEYEIVNPADAETRVEFKFPLPAEAKLYEDVWVKVNGVELTNWRVASNAITWDDRLTPGQKETVAIHYRGRGMDRYLFKVSQPRELVNFSLTVLLDTDSFYTRTEPNDNSLQPAERLAPPYHLCYWTVDRSVMSPVMGVELGQHWPYAPYQDMITVLPNAARASVLFLSLATLTLLICSVAVSLYQTALLASLFMLPFLPLMAGGLPAPASVTPAQLAAWQVNMLPVLSIVPLALALVFLRKMPRLPLALTLLLMALFMGGYARLSLIPDDRKRNDLASLIQAGMIAYVFALALFVRIRRSFRRPAVG